jgi:hypothetical protein
MNAQMAIIEIIQTINAQLVILLAVPVMMELKLTVLAAIMLLLEG